MAPEHGGQLRAIAQQFGIPEQSLLDLSASIHPIPPAPQVLESLAQQVRTGTGIGIYPESTYADLRAALGEYAQANPAGISVANGVMPLLQAAASALHLTDAFVLVPAFAGYAHALGLAGTHTHAFPLASQNNFLPDWPTVMQTMRTTDANALLLANPHSPSGTLLTHESLHAVADDLAAMHKLLILDEAFIDFVPESSLAHLAATSRHIVVLRSVTKFFAMPGARVAYAIAHPENKARIDACLPAWPVDTLAAQLAMLQVAQDSATRRAQTHTERVWLAAQLESLGLRVFPGNANFLLFHCLQPADLWQRMIAEHRVVIRDCQNFAGLGAGFYRTAIRTRPESERLLSALQVLLN